MKSIFESPISIQTLVLREYGYLPKKERTYFLG